MADQQPIPDEYLVEFDLEADATAIVRTTYGEIEITIVDGRMTTTIGFTRAEARNVACRMIEASQSITEGGRR